MTAARDSGGTPARVLVRVFLSHSTHTDESRAYFKAVKRALEADGRFELYADSERLLAGDDWRREIYRWLDESHAAVILLSGEALHSGWVGIETAVISFLYVRKPVFKAVPVELAEGIERSALAASLKWKDQFQFVKKSTPAKAAKEVVRALGDQGFIDSVLESVPRRNREMYIAARLRDAGFDEALLAALQPEGEAKARAARAACEVFARVLLSGDFAGACALIRRLDERLKFIRKGYRPVLNEILDVLKPGWVTETDATIVAVRAVDDRQARCMALCADDEFVIESLIRRAEGNPVEIGADLLYLEPPAGDGEDDDLAGVRDQLVKHFIKGRTPRDAARYAANPVANLQRTMADSDEDGRPVVIVFPNDWAPTATLVERLRALFPTPMLLFGKAPKGLKMADGLRDLTRDTAAQAQRSYDRTAQLLLR